MTDTNVIPLRPRQDAPVQPLPRSISGLRRSVFEGGMDIGPAGKAGMEAARDADGRQQELFKQIGRDIRAAKASADEVVQLSDILDKVAQRARELARMSGRSALQIVAQDVESLSERLVHIAADLPEGA